MFAVLWERGLDVLATAVDATTKTITAMLGSSVAEETHSSNAEWWQHVGFTSRPSKPTKGSHSAQVVMLKGTDVDAVIGSRDIRGQAIYGNLRDGETCVYATGTEGTGQARILLKDDGSINLYTRVGNTPDGAGMTVMVTPASNKISLINGLGFGIIIDTDGVTITAGGSGGGLTLGGDGTVKLVGTQQTQIDGSTVVLGSTVLTGVNSALKGLSGVAGSPSLKVLIE